jgi:hypothetical protein
MNHLLFFYLSRTDGSPLFRVFTKLYPSVIDFSRENIENVTSESSKATVIYVPDGTGMHFHNPDQSAGACLPEFIGTTLLAFHHPLKVFLGLVVVLRIHEIEEMNRDRGLVKITGQWREWPLGEEEQITALWKNLNMDSS